jgi:hypothetical protein
VNLNIIFEKMIGDYLLADPKDLFSFQAEYDFLIGNNCTNTIYFHRLPLPPDEKDYTQFTVQESPEFKGKIREAREYIESMLQLEEPKTILLTSSFAQQTDRLEALFQTHNIQRLNKESIEPQPIRIPKIQKIISILPYLK